MNDDAELLRDVESVLASRRLAGLDGLVGNLAAVVINVAPQDLVPAAEALLNSTGLAFEAALDDPLTGDGSPSLVLRDPGGPDLILKSRDPAAANPFSPYNCGIKTAAFVPARLETFVFECRDLERYAALQRERGVAFAAAAPRVTDAFSFVQTAPSAHTGNSLGFIQWKGRPGTYRHGQSRLLPLTAAKAQHPWLARIGGLDHVATRVRAKHRNAAIVEFLSLTNYRFDFAVYVESLNSITNVARLGAGDYAQVFTSGIGSPREGSGAGPTEGFIANYGLRPHHMAFCADGIEEVVSGLRLDGMEFLSELIGSRREGLKQIFSAMSPKTMLVNEYIERYDGFDGFFTKSNVTRLTKATEKQ
ncbi:hypothetical protein [Desulfovibrio sp. TomC]|uniref:hypothetical protein n=1 Tax=Desulfovibrio sp. TomC TaxID=1562888 RepID=UPI00057311B4|nr:hypothetical protein [Desulfovibrio sp. TomC]KHK04487.1 hypothetical protein NY78_0268 [Desulfovibrio sp. TomC]